MIEMRTGIWYIGSFDLSATVNKDDIQSGTTEEVLAIRERQAIAVMEGKGS